MILLLDQLPYCINFFSMTSAANSLLPIDLRLYSITIYDVQLG